MGEGWPKVMDVVVMPAIAAVATTRSRKMTPAHEGRGSSLPPLPLQPQQRQQVQFFWQQPNDVNINTPATAEPA
jgi:hypothetical protein